MRCRFKLTHTLTGEKNRVQNCLTVSNLKLDDVFGKSARSITNNIPSHPGGTFNIIPFVDRCCKSPIEKIQTAVDKAFSLSRLSNPVNVPHTSTGLKPIKRRNRAGNSGNRRIYLRCSGPTTHASLVRQERYDRHRHSFRD